MAKAIVHRLEAIEIDHDHGQVDPVALRPLEGHGEGPVEGSPVGKSRQAVVEGLVLKPLGNLDNLGDIPLDSHELHEAAALIPHRRDGQKIPEGRSVLPIVEDLPPEGAFPFDGPPDLLHRL